MKLFMLFLCLLALNIAPIQAQQAFTPKDTLIATNVFQVEFSTDSRSMVWCEQIPLSAGRAKIWYADVNVDTGLPNFAQQQLIDTIQAQGWPYWGHDTEGRFFLYMNQRGEVHIVRRSVANTLTNINLGTVRSNKTLLNVNADSTKPYFWINYVIRNPVRDSLFCVRSDKLNEQIFIASEVPNMAGSAYELTFPRWLAQSEILAYPFRPNPTLPVWDMKFWYGNRNTSRTVTNDIAATQLNNHVDDLPFTLPQLPGDTLMFTSRGSNRLAIQKRNATTGVFEYIETYDTPTMLRPVTLTSFEPFVINGNKTYGAYQVYEGGGIPGTTRGEIWLKGILGETLQTKISTLDGVTVDPEYVIGRNKVWIYYYGKPVGQQYFDLHRCETPLTIAQAQTYTLTVQNGFGSGTYKAGDSVFVWANPNARGTVFDKWTGDIATMRYPLEYRSTLVMPARNTSIQATYRTAPVWTAASGTRMGTEFYYYAPPNYKGVVTFFHGAGGSAKGWVDTNNVENRNFAEYAVASGYAVLATESLDRLQKRWIVNTTTSNPDFTNVFAIFDDLVAQGVFKRTDKLFGVGMSQGSGFTSIITAANPMRYVAATLYCVPGQTQAIAVTTVPTMWCMARNDTSEVFTRVADAKANYDVLVRRGIPTEFYVNEGSPVFPLRFWRISGIDSAGSRVAYHSFKSAGLLDAQDFLTIDPRVSDVWTKAIPQQYRHLQGGFEDQLYAAFAQHKFYSDFNNKTIMFFNKQFGMTGVEETVRNAAKIYPNPASNLVRIEGVEGSSELTLTNMLGQIVMTKTLQQMLVTLDVSSLPSGMYCCRLTAQGRSVIQPIVISR